MSVPPDSLTIAILGTPQSCKYTLLRKIFGDETTQDELIDGVDTYSDFQDSEEYTGKITIFRAGKVKDICQDIGEEEHVKSFVKERMPVLEGYIKSQNHLQQRDLWSCFQVQFVQSSWSELSENLTVMLVGGAFLKATAKSKAFAQIINFLMSPENPIVHRVFVTLDGSKGIGQEVEAHQQLKKLLATAATGAPALDFGPYLNVVLTKSDLIDGPKAQA